MIHQATDALGHLGRIVPLGTIYEPGQGQGFDLVGGNVIEDRPLAVPPALP
jgi:hypothetical protein